MDCATEKGLIIQEIDWKTKAVFVNVTPARKCKLSSGITVNFHRREHDVIRAFLASEMFTRWHWFSYHFQFYSLGLEHCFAKSLVDAIVNIGKSVKCQLFLPLSDN